MPRRLRYYPCEHLVEVVTRTRDGQFLLAPQVFSKPEDDLHGQLLGLVERYRAQKQGKVFALHIGSNHYHALVAFPDASRLSAFMRDFNGQAARLVKRLRDGVGEGGVWARRYAHSVVLDDESALDRVRYIFAQAVEAGVCAKPADWPGAQCVDALCRGARLVGTWFGYDQRRRKVAGGHEPPPPKQYTVQLSPLPQFAGLPVKEQQARYQAIEEEVVLAAAHKRAGLPPSREVLLRTSPLFKPDPGKLERSPIPQWHCTESVDPPGPTRRRYWDDYCDFVDHYRPLLVKTVRQMVAEMRPCGTIPWPQLAT